MSVMNSPRIRRWLGLLILTITTAYGCGPSGNPAFPQPPPAPPEDGIRFERRAGYVWIEGHWTRHQGKWSWIPGHYTRARPDQIYRQGFWEERDGSWYYVPGQWLSNRHDHIWVRGHWELVNEKILWQRGYWIPTRQGHVWVPGQWIRTGRRYRWVPGQWRPGVPRLERSVQPPGDRNIDEEPQVNDGKARKPDSNEDATDDADKK